MSDTKERTIVHMDLDTFFVSVERLMDSKLENRPVMIGGLSDRGVVASCSYEARKFGVHSGMSMKMARALCPQAVVLRGDSGNYSQYSKMVTEIVRESVPLYEKTSIDEFYIDMTGMDRFFGSYSLASELRKRIIRETGLPISFGMSINKTVAKIATGEAKPNNQINIRHGEEKPFMAPLSVQKIPMIGKKTAFLLQRMGITRIETLQQMPLGLMEKALGRNGVMIWNKANAIDNTPLVPYHERKSISTERTFERDTIDVVRLKNQLLAMTEHLAYELRSGGRLTACITVRIRYSDFNTYSKQKHIPYTSCDHQLISYVMELFDSLYSKRLMVRLIGVRFSDLVGGGHQIDLFNDKEEMISLYQAMDRIRDRFGSGKLKRAAAMDAMSLARSSPFNGEPPVIPAHRRA